MKMEKLKNNIGGIELYRISKLNYQLVDITNNKESVFVNVLHSDTEENTALKIQVGKDFLLSKRK